MLKGAPHVRGFYIIFFLDKFLYNLTVRKKKTKKENKNKKINLKIKSKKQKTLFFLKKRLHCSNSRYSIRVSSCTYPCTAAASANGVCVFLFSHSVLYHPYEYVRTSFLSFFILFFFYSTTVLHSFFSCNVHTYFIYFLALAHHSWSNFM